MMFVQRFTGTSGPQGIDPVPSGSARDDHGSAGSQTTSPRVMATIASKMRAQHESDHAQRQLVSRRRRSALADMLMAQVAIVGGVALLVWPVVCILSPEKPGHLLLIWYHFAQGSTDPTLLIAYMSIILTVCGAILAVPAVGQALQGISPTESSEWRADLGKLAPALAVSNGPIIGLYAITGRDRSLLIFVITAIIWALTMAIAAACAQLSSAQTPADRFVAAENDAKAITQHLRVLCAVNVPKDSPLGQNEEVSIRRKIWWYVVAGSSAVCLGLLVITFVWMGHAPRHLVPAALAGGLLLLLNVAGAVGGCLALTHLNKKDWARWVYDEDDSSAKKAVEDRVHRNAHYVTLVLVVVAAVVALLCTAPETLPAAGVLVGSLFGPSLLAVAWWRSRRETTPRWAATIAWVTLWSPLRQGLVADLEVREQIQEQTLADECRKHLQNVSLAEWLRSVARGRRASSTYFRQ